MAGSSTISSSTPRPARARWRLSVAMGAGPASLLPESIPYVPTARAEDGRWFVQSYGEFAPRWPRSPGPPGDGLARRRPGRRGCVSTCLARLRSRPSRRTVPTLPPARPGRMPRTGRSGLVLRRRSADGSTLKTTFVTVFEPTGRSLRSSGSAGSPHRRRPWSSTSKRPAGPSTWSSTSPRDHADGRPRSRPNPQDRRPGRPGLGPGLVLAGGTFAESGGLRVEQHRRPATITGVVRHASAAGRGWFESDQALPDAGQLAGRTVLIRHGNDVTRAWTLQRVENMNRGHDSMCSRSLDSRSTKEASAEASYYQFPRISAPARTDSGVSKITSHPGPQKVSRLIRRTFWPLVPLTFPKERLFLPMSVVQAIPSQASPIDRSIGFDYSASSLFRPCRSRSDTDRRVFSFHGTPAECTKREPGLNRQAGGIDGGHLELHPCAEVKRWGAGSDRLGRLIPSASSRPTAPRAA